MQPSKPQDEVSVVTQEPGQKKPISRIEFLNALFKEVKASKEIAGLLGKEPGTLSKAEFDKMSKWATDTRFTQLEYYLKGIKGQNSKDIEVSNNAGRDLITAGAYFKDEPVVSDYFFQQGKSLIERGLALNKNNVSLLNAQIIYESEYENAPMKFLGTLRNVLKLDSNNEETNQIHFSLLKKSGQLEKALEKCKKMLSLQPHSESWLYQTSDIYGMMGDTANSRTFLNLAMKAKKTK